MFWPIFFTFFRFSSCSLVFGIKLTSLSQLKDLDVPKLIYLYNSDKIESVFLSHINRFITENTFVEYHADSFVGNFDKKNFQNDQEWKGFYCELIEIQRIYKNVDFVFVMENFLDKLQV